MMVKNINSFSNQKILIYGLGKSGLSTFRFLKNKSEIFLFDDYSSNLKNFYIKKKLISYKKISSYKFDKIIVSPGIDINKCKLKRFLKKNYNNVYSDLDVFYSFFKNDCITITGTNGKSTTCQLMYEVLLNQKLDAKLVGNIGKPILSAKNVKKKTIFVIEASSYQLQYSKIFKSKYAVILNLSPDHIERHKTMNKYAEAKFKLIKSQSRGHFAFVKEDNSIVSKKLKSNKFCSKVIKVNSKKLKNFLKNIKNDYFSTEANKENLSFILELSKTLSLKKNLLIASVQKFKGLKYRQQIVFKNKYLTIINDSKSTSFSSSLSILKKHLNIYWLLGGIHKSQDRFTLSKKYFKNIKAFVFGNNKKFFNSKLKNKIEYKNFKDLNTAFKKILMTIKINKTKHQTILFSPCAASFDEFKNFEERGSYFNRLVKKNLNELQKINL